jgi:hypothetical protein
LAGQHPEGEIIVTTGTPNAGPFVPEVLAATVVAQQAVLRVGARPPLIAGGMLGPMLVLGAGLGPLFVLIFLVGLTKVRDDDAGVASSLVNVGQQVGGAIGLAVVGTVAGSAVASSLRSQAGAAAKEGVHASAGMPTRMYDHALAAGFSRGYLVSAGILALAVTIALFVMRVTRADLSGAGPASEPAGDASSPNLA